MLLPVSKEQMAKSYPELDRGWGRIAQVAYAGDAFRRTLSAGTTIPDVAVAKAKTGATTLSGADAFALHDTYGFPIDLTLGWRRAGVPGRRGRLPAAHDRAARPRQADARAKKSTHGDTSVYRQVADELGREVEFTGYDEVTLRGAGRRPGPRRRGRPACGRR